mmetsp:Transcript_17318/g.44806  ORF Transcript_17318/g.44806 Transcript_17318/m.44806 type:complete len:360 (+) Transcript_17318:77-1156(+)
MRYRMQAQALSRGHADASIRTRAWHAALSAVQVLSSAAIVVVMTGDGMAAAPARMAGVVLALVATMASTLHAVLQPGERARAHIIASLAYGDIERVVLADPRAPREERMQSAMRWIGVVTAVGLQTGDVGAAASRNSSIVRPSSSAPHQSASPAPSEQGARRNSRIHVHPIASPQSGLGDSMSSEHALCRQHTPQLRRFHDTRTHSVNRMELCPAAASPLARPELVASLSNRADIRSFPPFGLRRSARSAEAPTHSRPPIAGEPRVLGAVRRTEEFQPRPTIVQWQPPRAPQLVLPRKARLDPITRTSDPNTAGSTPTPVPLTLQPSSESGKADTNVEDEQWTTTAVETPASAHYNLLS